MVSFRIWTRLISPLPGGILFLLLLLGSPGVQAAEDLAPHPELLRLQDSFVRIAEALAPVVVSIGTEGTGRHPEVPRRPDRPDVPPGEIPRRGTGSGFIFDSRGYILTNHHVVEDAGRIRVVLHDGREYPGEVVGLDPRTDLAVVRIHPDAPLPTARLGDSDRIRKGQWAIAIGHPFGLERTVTVGVISGVGRSGMGIAHYENFIQTDASISPGNSGGPLINLQGEVIGINTAVLTRGGGIGFAIPITMARQVAETLIKEGRVVRGFLGVLIQSLTREMAGKFQAPEPKGALVGDVLKDSPAAKAGMRQGDIIWEFEGRPVKDVPTLQRLAAAAAPGSRVAVTVLRGGRPEGLEVIMDELKEEDRGGRAVKAPPKEYGLSVEELPGDEAARLRERGAGGIRISKIETNSRAAWDGLRVGDVIAQVEGKPISNGQEFKQALTEAPKEVLVLVYRAGRGHFLVLQDPR